MIKLSLITSSLLVKCKPCVYTIQSVNIATMLDKFGKQGT